MNKNYLQRYLNLPEHDTPLMGESLFRAGTLAPAAETNAAENGVVNFTITTSDIDRYGDIVDAAGAITENFMANPVVLWNHDSWSTPAIGTCSGLDKQPDRIIGATQFHRKTAMSVEISDLVFAKVLQTCSIGFMPLIWEDIETPQKMIQRRYTSWELLEYSITNIPANPYALVSNGFIKSLRDGAERGIITPDGALYTAVTRLIAGTMDAAQRTSIERILQPKIKINMKIEQKKTKSLTPDQMAQAAADIEASLKTNVAEYLVTTYEMTPEEAQPLADATAAGARKGFEEASAATDAPPSDAPPPDGQTANFTPPVDRKGAKLSAVALGHVTTIAESAKALLAYAQSAEDEGKSVESITDNLLQTLKKGKKDA